jgi:hypothetical protein
MGLISQSILNRLFSLLNKISCDIGQLPCYFHEFHFDLPARPIGRIDRETGGSSGSALGDDLIGYGLLPPSGNRNQFDARFCSPVLAA